jgi:predicted dehydrogenase/nucleoside-diphosphate-sugar epimerase
MTSSVESSEPSQPENGTSASPGLLILGAGAVVTQFYLPALARLGWLKSVAISDRSEASIKAVREINPQVRTHTADHATLLRDRAFVAQFNGVIIALPNCLHEEAARLSLEAGLDVLCEKPLAMSEAQCAGLAAIAEKNGRKLAVGMVRRFMPLNQAIQNAIQSGLLGEIQEIDVAHGGPFAWPASSGSYFRVENGGLLLNMGVHYLDLIEYWLGPVSPFEYKDDACGGVEANFEIRLRSPKGAGVRVKLSITHELANRIVVRGSQGEITCGIGERDQANWRLYDAALGGTLRLQTPDPARDDIAAFCTQLRNFADVIARRAEPMVDVAQSASTHRIVDWCMANRRPLFGPVRRDASAQRPSLEVGRTVVTGGSGFLGQALIARLDELGFTDIVVPVRSYRSGANAARFPIERVLTDQSDPQSVRNVLKGARYVFHLAIGADGPDAGRVTVNLNRNVVDAAIEAGVESLVVVSTVAVFGHPQGGRPVDETFPYQPTLGEYGSSKAEAEKYALSKARSAGKTRISLINPPVIYGPNAKTFCEFPIRAAGRGELAWIEGGRGKVNYVYVDNVVDALLLAARSPQAHGERFIVCDGTCTMRQFLTPLLGAVADTLSSYTREELLEYEQRGRPGWRDLARALMNAEVMRAVNRIPALSAPKKFIERYLAGFYARAQSARRGMQESSSPAASGDSSAMPPAWLADIYGTFETEFTSAKAVNTLGWKPLVSLEAGLEASVQWLEAMGITEAAMGPGTPG